MALKVNVDKVLADYNALVEKQSAKLAEIDTFAQGIAKQRGWDEERTARFVEFVESEDNNGLSEEDGIRLNILDEYIDEAADDVTAEPAIKSHAPNATSPNATNTAAVNVL